MEEHQQIDKFLEKDIIEYLDQKRKETKENTPSEKFYSMLKLALNEKNTKEAAEIIEEAINKYNTISSESTYKTIIYEEILEIIELSKKYEEKYEEKTELTKVLELLQRTRELENEAPNRITALESLKKERARQRLQEEEKSYKEKAKIELKIKEITKKIFINLRKKNLKESILNYKELKTEFQKYPKKYEAEKQELYSDLLAYYMEINKLKKEIQEKTKTPKKEEKETQNQKIKKEELLEMKKITKKIEENTKNQNFHEAKSEIIELKKIATKQENKTIRKILEEKINKINQKVLHAEKKEKMNA